MSKTVVILDDTPEGQKLGVAMLGSIGSVVSSVQFLTISELPVVADPQAIYCPLTLDIPPTFQFWGQLIGRSCRDIDQLRDLAANTTGVKVGSGGNLWLPVISTARGPIYGEVIGLIEPNKYQQPIHLDDIDRQPLYQFGYQLLSQLVAPPATYLIQFSKAESGIVFDRLFPFPAIPALASISVQHPDLFACHWRCITQQSIIDLYSTDAG
jgi:hypothetical protein